MPSQPPPLATLICSLLRPTSRYVLLIPAALGGCGGGGDDTGTATPLSVDQAAPVMAQQLESVRKGVEVQVGFSALITITCDNLGTWSVSGVDRLVCQIYDADGAEGVPHLSPDGVDLVSRVPSGDSSAVLAAADADLQGAAWAPLLKSTVLDLGDFNLGATISGQFTLQGGDGMQIGGSCAIVDSEGNTDATATLNRDAIEGREATLTFGDARGFGLTEGQYSLDCTFTEGEASNTIENAGGFQVLYNNTAPTAPSGVVLVDEASLLVDPNGNIRDINGSDFCVRYTQPGTDAEDPLLGQSVTTEGFYTAGGIEYGPVVLAGESSYCIDVGSAGGQHVNAGFKSKDSQGAYSALAAVLRRIDANEAPTPSNAGDFDGSGSYSCDEGNCNFPTLTGPTYSDPEGDAVTTTYYQDGTAVGTGSSYTPSGLTEGAYRLSAKGTDAYGATSILSASYTLTVGRPNTAPSYASGSFPGSYACTEGSCNFPTLQVTSCSDAEEDRTTARIYLEATQVAEGALTLSYTPSALPPGTYHFYGACVDEHEAEGDKSSAYSVTVSAAPGGGGDDGGPP